MRTQSVEAVTVTNIAEKCGVTRQTFYRNFLDKYDLINWYFGKLLTRSFEHMGSGRTIAEGLERKFEYIRQERVFFTAAFRADGTNSLKEHDFEAIMAFYLDVIQKKTGAAPTEDERFALELYCRGSVAMTVKWVLGGMREAPREMSLPASSPPCPNNCRSFSPVCLSCETDRVTIFALLSLYSAGRRD